MSSQKNEQQCAACDRVFLESQKRSHNLNKRAMKHQQVKEGHTENLIVLHIQDNDNLFKKMET